MCSKIHSRGCLCSPFGVAFLWKTNPIYLLKSIQQEYREYSMLLHDLKKWM